MNGRSSLLKIDNQIYYKILRNPWPYWLGGILLGLVNILYLLFTRSYWSITTTFTYWGAWILKVVGIDINGWEAWQHYKYIEPYFDKKTWSNLGIIMGALIAILLASQFKVKKIKNKKYLLIGLLGGWLMGYGARIAIGCNIGGLFSAISSFSISGWVYLPFVILGIFVGSKFLIKWLY